MEAPRQQKRPTSPIEVMRGRRGGLTKTLVAALSLHAGISSARAIEEPQNATSIEKSSSEIESVDVIEKTLATLDASSETLRSLEIDVLTDVVPDSVQIAFLEKAFSKNGPYTRDFNDQNLTEERLSEIMAVANHVSSTLNVRYLLGSPIENNEYLFNVEQLRYAARYMEVDPQEGQLFCNGFFVRDVSLGEVKFVTDKHCGNTDLNKLGYTLAIDGSDQALIHIPREDLKTEGIPDIKKLPILDSSISEENLFGHVVSMYAWDKNMQEVVDFSVLMPLTAPVRRLLFGKDVDEKFPFAKHNVLALKPPFAAHVDALKPDGTPLSINASGESGSITSIPTRKGHIAIGSLVSLKVLTVECKKLCVGAATINRPSTLSNLSALEKSQRFGGWRTTFSKESAVSWKNKKTISANSNSKTNSEHNSSSVKKPVKPDAWIRRVNDELKKP